MTDIPKPTPEDMACDLAEAHAMVEEGLAIAPRGTFWDLYRAALRRAAAAEAERDLLLGQWSEDVDKLLDRWDQTEPALQRQIVAAFAARLVEARTALPAWIRRTTAAEAKATRLRTAALRVLETTRQAVTPMDQQGVRSAAFQAAADQIAAAWQELKDVLEEKHA